MVVTGTVGIDCQIPESQLEAAKAWLQSESPTCLLESRCLSRYWAVQFVVLRIRNSSWEEAGKV